MNSKSEILAGGDRAPVRVGAVEPLAGCPTVHGRSHERGTHPHPSWSPDSRSVIYNSDETGRAQICQAFVR